MDQKVLSPIQGSSLLFGSYKPNYLLENSNLSNDWYFNHVSIIYHTHFPSSHLLQKIPIPLCVFVLVNGITALPDTHQRN